jgi:hypothetical protein
LRHGLVSASKQASVIVTRSVHLTEGCGPVAVIRDFIASNTGAK